MVDISPAKAAPVVGAAASASDSEVGEPVIRPVAKPASGGAKPPAGPVIRPDMEDSRPAAVPPAAGTAAPPPAVPASGSGGHRDPFLGKTYGGYELVEQIGHGGMGMVYKGRQVSLDRMVAVKLLNKALVDNDEFIKRFKREAQAMAAIHHPNIVSVIDFGEHEKIWYMVAEFVEGTNLAKLIRERIMVPIEELLPLIIQCLSGLAYVSKSGIVHRDIKPDNILIDKDNVAKIADFGLAKDINNDQTDLTAVGSAMGTPAYMSPEQCMGRKLDVRSDVYSLGVTAYYALTGEKPFTGQSSFEVMVKQREFSPPPPIQLNPRIPKPISELVMRMIEKNPDSRFRDADACRESWIAAGQTLGLLGSVTRSGEFLFTAPPATDSQRLRAASVAYPDDAPPPAARPPGTDLVSKHPPSAPPLPPPPSAEVLPPGTEPIVNPNLPPERKTPSSRVGVNQRGERSDSARRNVAAGRSGAGTTGEFLTCPRCGHLNHSNRRECERCQTLLQPDRVEQSSPAEQLAEADRLFRKNNFREALRLYAQLAEREADRRQRSVLRAKEREARTRLEEEQAGEAEQRSQRLIAQGDVDGALKVLDRALADSSSAVVSQRLQDHIATLQKQEVGRRRRRRLLVSVVVVILALAGAGYAFRVQVMAFVQSVQHQGKAP